MNGTLVDSCDYPGYVDTILGLLEDESDYATKEYRYYDPAGGSAAAETTIGGGVPVPPVIAAAHADGPPIVPGTNTPADIAAHFTKFRDYLLSLVNPNLAIPWLLIIVSDEHKTINENGDSIQRQINNYVIK